MTTTPTSGAADLPEALINIAREIEALKRDCGMDPESAIAIQNGRYMAISYKVRALAAGQATAAKQPDSENLRKALQFYADSEHFIKADGDAWDTVSGEPQNYWCDEAGTATVEDGHIARLALSGHPVRFEDDAAQPAAQQGVAYAGLPEPDIAVGNDGRARIYTRKDIVGEPYYTAGQLRAFADATHALRASHGQAPAKPDPAYSAACHLATSLFKKHFAHLPDFASGQAVWSLCDSTAGVISQIDNMVSGLVQPPTTAFSEDEL